MPTARGVVRYLSWASAREGGHTVTSLRIWQLFKTALPCPPYLIKRVVNLQQISYRHWCCWAGGFPITRHSMSLDRNSHCLSAQPWGKKSGITAWHYGQIWQNVWFAVTVCLLMVHMNTSFQTWNMVKTIQWPLLIPATNYTTSNPA